MALTNDQLSAFRSRNQYSNSVRFQDLLTTFEQQMCEPFPTYKAQKFSTKNLIKNAIKKT